MLMCGALSLIGSSVSESESGKPLVEMRLLSGGDVGDREPPLLSLVVFPSGRALYAKGRSDEQISKGRGALFWTGTVVTTILPELTKLARHITRKAGQPLKARCMFDAVEVKISLEGTIGTAEYCTDGRDWFNVQSGTEEHLTALVSVLRQIGRVSGTEVSPMRVMLKRTSGYSAQCTWPDGVALPWGAKSQASGYDSAPVYLEANSETIQKLLILHGCPTRLAADDKAVWILEVEPVW